ncbi:MAG: GTP-binding protein [Candidatus Berkelbacteria bacterium]|nr:GTP-binding protein [Candidatus Berkelbacteria bacterium]
MTENIRNFCIISHIDHGKSTLADRFLELTKTVEKRKMHDQILDSMDLEREKGITIKLQPVRMLWHADVNNESRIRNNGVKDSDSSFVIHNSKFSNSELFILNLIDTPGHVDFSYEVSRSLAAVEGAILLVDATQGVQAQTLANLELARHSGLTIIPVVNKIDLPEANPDEVALEISEILNVPIEDVLFVSAKTGEGVNGLIGEVIKRIPPPRPGTHPYPRALVFDSFYDDYRGVVVYVRVFDGKIKRGDKIFFFQQNKQSCASEVGTVELGLKAQEEIGAGEIGYIVTALKDVSEARVGETVTTLNNEERIKNNGKIHNGPPIPSYAGLPSFAIHGSTFVPLPGYGEPNPFVFAELYTSGKEYGRLREALFKLKLSDSSITFVPTTSSAFGFGFKCGFLGLLHLEVVKERLEREHNLDLIVTTPTVDYKVKEGRYEEPWAKVELILPQKYLGRVIELMESRRGLQRNIKHLETKILVEYEMPLSEVIIDFYDQVKSLTQGYGSLNYEIIGYRESDLVQLDFLIAGEKIEAFSRLVYRPSSQSIAKNMVGRMKQVIPRQAFEVKIQATIGTRIVASERLAPFRKDVTEKLYGGDVTRKKKLLEKQKKGKKKMAQIGKVSVPTDVFIKLLRY